ncbi:tetratricopeptide repeat protein [Pseudozobellia thermophila]|uniref:histidine kinase n=1 Tax=Pseudozobellia thermophila TaxID=192903 RepID=A0A1M6MWI2_9FLAO|nr:tetratricopeptide repeat protein [Pseudozobellia thermophila]SHJ87750.1 hypothetical protein SAMN04488513_11132 [Pseudozobellia thermophila]
MKKITLLALVGLFVFCTPRKKKIGSSDPLVETDSISYYYKRSKDKRLSLQERCTAIQRSYALAKTKARDSIYGQVLYRKNLLHLSAKQYDSLLAYSKLLIGQESKLQAPSVMARQYYLLGYYYDEVAQDYAKAIASYTASKNQALKYNDSSLVGKSLMNIGVLQKDQNDFFGSKETLVEALKFIKDPLLATYCHNALGTDHRKLLNHSEAINYYKKAIKGAGTPDDRILYQNNLATAYIDNREYEKAEALLKTISKDTALPKNQKQHARVLDNLAYARWLSGLEIGEGEFQLPLNMRKAQNDLRGQIASYTHLGEFFSNTDKQRAKVYFDSVIQLSKRLGIPRAEKDALQFLMPLEPSNVKLRDRYVFLQDSLYVQELKVKTQFAKYIYDDQLRQESIRRLEKANLEHELEAVRQRNQKIISVSALILVLLTALSIGYFLVQRGKQLKQQNRTAKLEATYETEASLSRKLHDDFGGKLNHAMVLLQNGTSPEKVLDVVGELYNQSRNFSREINDVDTGPNFKDTLFGILEAYSKNTQLFITGSKDVQWNNLSPLSKKTLYKVLQELMINMQKHSKATMVFISFEQSKKTLKINYSDNGIGVSPKGMKNKNGLRNTEKRIHAIDGSIIFDSSKGEGFNAFIEIPN